MSAALEFVLRKARRLGHDDPQVVAFAMAVRVSEVLEGPPLWGMLVGPASGGKTEIITLCGDGTYEMGDVTLPGLLSFKKVGKAGHEKFFPVGALTRIGPKADRDKGVYRGAITIPEFSGVLADSNVGKCDRLYAFMRMMHDGRAPRDLGQVQDQLEWEGHVTILAGCTGAIDSYGTHAQELGPRWVYLRLVRHGLEERHARNRHARRRSRDSLAKLKTEITDLIREAQKSVPDADDLDDELRDAIDVAAELCAHGRTAVPRASHGSRDINGVVETEESFRLVGQLTTLARCVFALGMDDAAVLELVRRAARDSMPQIRRDVLVTVRDADGLNTNEIAGRVAHDWKTVKRALDDLELIGGGMVERTESGRTPKDVPIYRWSITPAFEGIVAGQPSDLTLKEHPLSPQLVSTSRVSSDGGSASTHTSRDASPAGLLSETTARGRESG